MYYCFTFRKILCFNFLFKNLAARFLSVAQNENQHPDEKSLMNRYYFASNIAVNTASLPAYCVTYGHIASTQPNSHMPLHFKY